MDDQCNCTNADVGLHVPGCVKKPSQGIGDVTSDTKGTGARFNAGKVPYELMAIKPMAMTLHAAGDPSRQYVRGALMALGEFQSGGDATWLGFVLRDTASACDLSIVELMAETARVLEYGAIKYDAWNWAKGMPWQSVIGCAARHLLGTPGHPGIWSDPAGIDADSGFLHAGHVGCNVMFLLQFMLTYPEGDDRPKRLIESPF